MTTQGAAPRLAEGRAFRGRTGTPSELGAARFTDCTFDDVDLTRGDDGGRDVRAVHVPQLPLQLLAPTPRPRSWRATSGASNLFDATLDGCKLVGSRLRRVHAAAAHGARRPVARGHPPRHDPGASST